MTGVDRELLAERVAVVERHLARVAARLPAEGPLVAGTDASDAVVLHLWQAAQIVIDLAVAACVRLGLGSPPTYGDAFRSLAAAGHLDRDLAERLARAAGFRNAVAHAYESHDLDRVREAALAGPSDFRAFLAQARQWS